MIITKCSWSLVRDFNQQEGAHEESGTIRHIIVSIIQFITVVWPGLLLLQESRTHCRYAGDDFGCHFRLRKYHASCIGCREGWNCAVLWLLFLILTRLFHSSLKLVALWQNKKFWFGLIFIKNRGQTHLPWHRIGVFSKQKLNGLNPGSPTGLAPRAGAAFSR